MEEGVTYTIETSLETLVDSEIFLFDADGSTELDSNDNYGEGVASRIVRTATTSQVYFIAVAGHSGTGSYTLTVSIGAPPPTTPTVVDVEFVSDGSRGSKITVPVGSSVESKITLTARADVSGTARIEIRKDIEGFAFDINEKFCPQSESGTSVMLSKGESKTITCVFVADELTSGDFRHWFVRVTWNGTLIYDPMVWDTRPNVQTISEGL